MTNEEARSVLIKTKVMCVSGKFTEWEKAQKLAYDALQENTKLKAEIEQLKENYDTLARQYENVENSSIRYYNELKQLKSELKQSVKLPCKVGQIVYDNDFGKPTPSKIVGYSFGDIFQDDYSEIDEEQIYFYSKSNRFNIDMSFSVSEIGKTIFLSREEAEQSLKDKIKDKQLEARIEADNVKKDFKEFCDKRDKEEIKFREVK